MRRARFTSEAKTELLAQTAYYEKIRKGLGARFRTEVEAAEHDAWFGRQVQIGLDAANSGNLVQAAEVDAEAEAWRTEMLRRMAGSGS